MTIARPSRLRNGQLDGMAICCAYSAFRMGMTTQLGWADGGVFRVVEGRRVWVEGAPESARDELERAVEERAWGQPWKIRSDY